MENLNAEQIIKALECCASEEYICTQCPIDEKIKDDCECGKVVARNALALITSQEQRVKELETESERLKARTVEALTEFAESVKRYYSALPGATVGAAVRFYVDEKLKEALDKI